MPQEVALGQSQGATGKGQRVTQHGVSLASGGGNTIAGNYIGTDVLGTTDLGNGGSGVIISSTGTNTIGGTAVADRNLISGNNAQGITITGTTATGNQVLGGLIGTQANGTTALANGGDGVHIDTSAGNNTIGGTGAGAANTIAFNIGDGVNLISTAGTGNAIRGNSIQSNGSLGIDLGLNGVTPNDAGDPDSGANNLQNFPVLTSAVKRGGDTLLAGTFNSTANTSFAFDFYASDSCDASGNGEGVTYIGSAGFATDGTGNFSFDLLSVGPTTLGQIVTATATRIASPLDTSEFSNCVTVGPMVVDTTSDASLTTCRPAAAGDCSLRGAITQANTDAAPDTVYFNIPGCPVGVCTITPTSALPAITQPVTIDGYTQTGAAANTNDTTLGMNAVLRIELNGASAGGGVNGLEISGGNSVIQGLVVNRFQGDGIFLSPAGGNAIAGNFIGTNVAGSADLGNGVDGIGILFEGNCIGGTMVNSICTPAPAHRNLISGNDDDGVSINSTSTASFVMGNIIGLDAGGTFDIGNTSEGVAIFSASNSQIGGPNPADRNIISGNDSHGIVINGGTGNKVYGNHIGTDVSGNLDRGNTLNGVATTGSAATSTIGALGGGRNIISGNNGHGVSLSGAASEAVGIVNNYIGTNADGTSAIPNSGDGLFTDTGGHVIGADGFPLWNLISGNLGNGIHFTGASASNNIVRTNRIGTQVNTAMPLKNGLNGILFDASADVNTIGGTAASQGNTIAFNGGDGARVDGAASINNTIRGNSIHSNVGKAIENINGGNAELAPPVIAAAGSASGTACGNCTVDLYSDGGDEGRVYHGSAVADGAGAWSFAGAVTGPNITATATDASGNTSEFSTPFTGCADTDGDLLCNSGDACPADSDCDNDGWSDGNELAFIGTDYQDACPENTLDNAWPADVTNDGLVDVIGDITMLANFFSQSVPPAPARYDVGEPPNGTIGVIDDIVRIAGLFSQSCVP
jgi:hypothetical protein